MKKISRRVALALKSLRETQGWSLDKAAEATGVSKAMLGQINGKNLALQSRHYGNWLKDLMFPFLSFLKSLSENFKNLFIVLSKYNI